MTHLGFSTSTHFNPVSWLVRKLTASRCSHVWFLYFDKDFDMDMVMEAHELGFRLLPYERFKKKNRVVAVITPPTNLDPGLKWAAGWLGTAYDFGGLIGMSWVLLARIFKKRARNPFQNSHAMFCSEIATTALGLSKMPGIEALTPSTTSPEMLLNFLERE